MRYLFGEGLGQDGDQVLQGPFSVEFTGVLRGAPLLRGLPLDESKQGETQNTTVKRGGFNQLHLKELTM